MGIKQHLKVDHRYFLRGGFWLGVLRGLSAGSSFLLALVYAHFLTKEVFGEFKFLLSCAAILGAMSLTGLANSIPPAVARGAEGTLPAALRLQLRWSWLLILGGLGLAAFQFFKGQHPLGISLLILAFCVPIYSAFAIYEALLKGRGEFRAVAKFGVTQKFARDLGIAFGAVAFGTLLPLSLGAFVLPMFFAIGAYVYSARTIPPKKQTVERGALQYGKKLSVFRAFNMGLNHFDNLLAFSVFGPASLAVYGFAKTIPDSLISLSAVAQPMILNKFSGKSFKSAKVAIFKGLTFFALAGCLTAALYYYVAPYLFERLFPQYVEAVPLSRIYALKLIPSGSFIVGLYFHAQFKMRRTLFVGGLRILIGYSSFIVFFVWRTLEAMVIARVVGEFLIAVVSVVGLLWGTGKARKH